MRNKRKIEVFFLIYTYHCIGGHLEPRFDKLSTGLVTYLGQSDVVCFNSGKF